jgi:serine/threonine protein kinase
MNADIRLGSSYTLHERIDSGAMGHVWRGTDTAGNELAFKVLRSEYAEDREVVNRFVQERSLLTTLRHPNIISVLDIVVEQDTLAIVMDLVRGENLRSRLSAAGTLSPTEAAQIVAGLCDGLAAVHAAGIVHRDIKPENVLLDTANGHVIPRVGDFGLAKIISADAATPRSSMMVGTPTYMAPEIADGAEPTDKADVYAVGIVLYELLSAVPPFASTSTWQLIRDHAQSQPGRPDGIPDPLWHLIDWMLSKSPVARPSAAQVRDELRGLEPVLAGLPAAPAAAAPPPGGELTNRPTMQVPRLPSTPPAPVTPPPSVPEAPPTASRGRAAKVAMVAGPALLLALLAGGWWAMQRDSDDSSTTAATGQSTPSDTTQPPTTQATTEPTVEAVVAMPDLVSKALSQTSVLLPPGTTVETTETLDETAVDGTILTQTPAPGTQPIPAVVQVTVARQSVTSYLKDLEAIESSMSADSTEVDGQVFPHALIGSLYSDRSASYALGRDYRRFVATVGLADDSPDSNAKATFEVFADGRKIFDETVGYGATAEIDLDVTGVLRLQLVNGIVAGEDASAVWGDARVLGLPGEVPAPIDP